MRKLLRPKDILLLGLAGVGDILEEVRDPFSLAASAYKKMYGFIPRRYTRNNFLQTVNRSLRTGDIEKIVKDGKVYLRLTCRGKDKVKRDFPMSNLIKTWNKHWTLLIFDIEEKSRVLRDSLRKKLRNIGFGMLQESVWITPLPIGEDVWELIESVGLNHNVFVMEVLALRFGDPREIARKVWDLDRLEDKCIKIKTEIEKINQLIANYNDRYKKREAKTALTEEALPHLYRLKSRKRVLMGDYLNLFSYLPPLPRELLPDTLKRLILLTFKG